eukprot:Colp12_sorted_trinity150504_noHs@30286
MEAKIEQFKKDVATYLAPLDTSRIVLASAWLVSDNVIVDLFKRFTNIFPVVVGVDTLHLFPETHNVVSALEAKYNFKARVYKPKGCETYADFVSTYGTHEKLSHADFDGHSKVEPLTRALEEINAAATITGRRCDQGNARTELAIWEDGKKTFNPVAEWSWADITAYVLQYDVPYNSLHRRLSIANEPVRATVRDSYDFKHVDLPKPYFAYTKEEINAHGPNVYVWKSFGDTHTSVPVEFHESERAGRFVGRLQTECGIHTRVTRKGMPHGGKLVDLLVTEDKSPLSRASHKIHLNERQTCDFELLVNGGFSPLTGFMDKITYDTVVDSYRLPEGELFGLPVTLDTDDENIKEGDFVELFNEETGARGVIQVESKWAPDRLVESQKVYGTTSLEHPSVFHLMTEKKKYNIGGRVWGLALPQRDWVVCKTPRQVRAEKTSQNLIAFQSRNPIHRAHAAMFLDVAAKYDADVLVHPVVGPTKDDDVPAKPRKLTYDALANRLDHVKFEYLPYSMMVGGPREALQHALIRKNYGCTGMIIGRDHAGCKNAKGEDFYGPYDAQDFMLPLQKELGIDLVAFKQMVYVEEEKAYISADEAKQKGYTPLSISGTKFRQMMVDGSPVPDWFAFPEVVALLRDFYLAQEAVKAA